VVSVQQAQCVLHVHEDGIADQPVDFLGLVATHRATLRQVRDDALRAKSPAPTGGLQGGSAGVVVVALHRK
jgi:hypothetical protein